MTNKVTQAMSMRDFEVELQINSSIVFGGSRITRMGPGGIERSSLSMTCWNVVFPCSAYLIQETFPTFYRSAH